MTEDELNKFNAAWLQAWTDKDIAAIAAMYASDCSYFDGANASGLTGRAALVAYLEALFPQLPEWRYTPDQLWPVDGGFCARWYCTMGDRRLRGFDFVLLRGHEIAHNEVYTYNL